MDSTYKGWEGRRGLDGCVKGGGLGGGGGWAAAGELSALLRHRQQ